MGSWFAELTREKRAKNTASSTKILLQRGIPFESKNSGAHLVVDAETHFVDFWPSGGRWIARDLAKTNGRGVFKMLKHIAKARRDA
ncbi:hypothetical protein [Azorhizophilus paspali]|uniref:Uncharacterized protein n=1 Tax=Azorhizophilus paspali TaxID=69963 RepID=A0ABV6SK66_AZOPA